MPFSFTILSPETLLILVIGILVINLGKKLFGHADNR
jgi:hypothetical protein